MGIKAHIVTEITYKYGFETFSNKQISVENMLEENGIDVRTHHDSEGNARMYIHTQGTSGKMYQRYIAKLEELPPEDEHEYVSTYTNKDVRAILAGWWEHRDKKSGIIRVDWF